MRIKTSFLKASSFPEIVLRACHAEATWNDRLVLNHDAHGSGSGLVRKIEGLNHVYIASCSMFFGDSQWLEIYDTSFKKIAVLEKASTLRELRNSVAAQHELIIINEMQQMEVK